MQSDIALRLLSDLLWNAVLISAPLLLVTLTIGLLVSIFQVVTQIQELSLTYIPKLIAAVLVLVSVGPWMLRRIVAYSSAVIANIPTYF